MKLTRIALAAVLGLTAGQALAQSADEEQLDTVSSFGTSEVTIIKQNAVQITDVDDIDFGTVSALDGTDNVQSDEVCVFSSTGEYAVEVTSANAFQLITDDTDTGGAAINDAIAYTVTWTDTTVPADAGALGADGTLAAQVGDQSSPTCNDATGAAGTNALFQVELNKQNFLDAAPAEYADTLTITVSPT